MYSATITVILIVMCSVINCLGEVVLIYAKGNIETCGESRSCIKKCCPEKHVLKNKVCTFSDDEFELKVFSGIQEISNSTDESTFEVFIEFSSNSTYTNCDGGKVLKLSPKFAEEDHFYLQENGSLLKPNDEVLPMVLPQFYCLETFVTPLGSELSALVCYMPDNLEVVPDTHFLIGMIISMPFLLLTFLVYVILPETSLHRRALMSYVLTLLVGYILLVTVQLNDNTVPNTLCHVLGYSIIFFFTVSFFWMNVMCIDMWLAFSGIRGFNGKKSAEKKRFIIYCLYAWGVPLLHILTVFLLNTYGDERSAYHPQLGYRKCFVEDGLPNLLYFYLPMAIVIVINIILFILTTIRIQKAKRETSMLKHTDSKRHSYEDDKQKFNLYLKLMLAMGINWSMELISWVVTWKINKSPTWIWYLTDFTNAIYGVVIFFLFVFKKKIWRSLKKRYYVWVGKPHLAHAMSTSASNRGTRTSNFSTTESGVNTDYRLSDIRNVKEEERALNRH
ncbi:unnamed protein product [Phaedon cochleariae]|uniref:Uncharacterized protein n=1 Tax=Phaedon cochleariae TaxID=80249 RepID=A0A9P0GQL8_PHACE|nr:unnamed protein product [Phaedon cochleariae]